MNKPRLAPPLQEYICILPQGHHRRLLKLNEDDLESDTKLGKTREKAPKKPKSNNSKKSSKIRENAVCEKVTAGNVTWE